MYLICLSFGKAALAAFAITSQLLGGLYDIEADPVHETWAEVAEVPLESHRPSTSMSDIMKSILIGSFPTNFGTCRYHITRQCRINGEENGL